MSLEWNALATIAAPVITLFVGAWVNRKFENRPILISYFGHISGFNSTPPGGTPIQVNTHAVVLRNTGRRSATNIRLHHATLPDFSIWPSVPYQTENLPDGTRDIVIPTLVPGEEITISYLYFPPLTAAASMLESKAIRVSLELSLCYCSGNIRSGCIAAPTSCS